MVSPQQSEEIMVAEMPLKALIAEDEGVTVMLLRRALTAAGYNVVGAARSGDEVVLKAEELQPDFIMMDITMPGMTGIEATRLIMERRPLPIIMLTAYSDQGHVDDAIAAGACAYMVKPVSSEQVTPTVRAALARFEQMQTTLRENSELKNDLEARKVVERAKGILMKRQELNEADAYNRLRKMARDKSVTMKQIAQEIIAADSLLTES
jgi:response regulator NasT